LPGYSVPPFRACPCWLCAGEPERVSELGNTSAERRPRRGGWHRAGGEQGRVGGILVIINEHRVSDARKPVKTLTNLPVRINTKY
jgi:hypothetical protein